MGQLVIGLVLSEVGISPGAESDVTQAQQATVVQAMTQEEFPNILQALAEYEFDWDDQFVSGLTVLIRGLDPLRVQDLGPSA